MSPAKTASERVAAMRAARDALGLKRLELYAHPEDWPAIKSLAERLQRKRAKKLDPPRAG
jgi:predicted component of type VI protein secretion system